MSTLAIRFAHPRASDGTDVARIIRANLPTADLRAELDESGAVASYLLQLEFEDEQALTEASFALRDFLAANGWEAEW